MDKHQTENNKVEKENSKRPYNEEILSVLHHNVQSINNKLVELDLLFNSSLKHIDVLCFMEHWIKEDNLDIIKIDQFKLVSSFSRKLYDHGGS
jgi:hypothetical protein